MCLCVVACTAHTEWKMQSVCVCVCVCVCVGASVCVYGMHTRELFHASVVVELAELSSVAQRKKLRNSAAVALERVKRRSPHRVLLCLVQSAAVRRIDYVSTISKTQTWRGFNGSCKFQSQCFHNTLIVHVKTTQDQRRPLWRPAQIKE